MDTTGYRIAVARGLNVLEHVAEDLLTDRATAARRDTSADRLLIAETVRRAHRRTARRRLVTRRT